MAWFWYAAVQLIQLIALLLGLIALPIPCLAQAWVADAKSIKDGRKIDRFTWPLNAVYGNPEDGVSGQFALVGGQPYLPTSGPRWRAFSWSALRNSADGLKYVLAWASGPYVTRTYTAFGAARKLQLGWHTENGVNVPVFSLW